MSRKLISDNLYDAITENVALIYFAPGGQYRHLLFSSILANQGHVLRYPARDIIFKCLCCQTLPSVCQLHNIIFSSTISVVIICGKSASFFCKSVF